MNVGKNLSALVALALLIPAIISCGQRATPKGEVVGEITEESTLIFEEAEWNFGTIKESDGVVVHTFSFTNGGDNAVVVESIVVSCSCTTFEYSKQPIMPGGTSQIKVFYDPAMRPGAFSKQIYVYSNSGKSTNMLMVKGDVEARPRTVEEDYPFVAKGGMRFNLLSLDLREVEHSEPKSMTIGYANTSKKEIAMRLDVTRLGDIFTAFAPSKICAGCKGEITITCLIPEGWTYGKIETYVLPFIDGKQAVIGAEPVLFRVRGVAVDNLESFRSGSTAAPESDFTPLFHNFGTIKRSNVVSKEFTITNSGNATLLIRAVESQSSVSTTLKIGDAVEAGKTVTFKVTLDSRYADFGFQLIPISIVTNDPQHAIRNLRISADIIE